MRRIPINQANTHTDCDSCRNRMGVDADANYDGTGVTYAPAIGESIRCAGCDAIICLHCAANGCCNCDEGVVTNPATGAEVNWRIGDGTVCHTKNEALTYTHGIARRTGVVLTVETFDVPA